MAIINNNIDNLLPWHVYTQDLSPIENMGMNQEEVAKDRQKQ